MLLSLTFVTRVGAAGSYRRRKETIGDLDLLAETADEAEWVELDPSDMETIETARRHQHALLEAGISLPPVAEASHRYVVSLPPGMSEAEIREALTRPRCQSATRQSVRSCPPSKRCGK